MEWADQDGMSLTVPDGKSDSRGLLRNLDYAADRSVGLRTEGVPIANFAPNMIFPAPTNTTLKS